MRIADRNKQVIFLLTVGSMLAAIGSLAEKIWASTTAEATQDAAMVNADAMDIDLDRGAAGLSRWLASIRTRASILTISAHPDDEDSGMLAYQTRGLGARGISLSLTRGEGGQNVMSADLYDELGLTRTEELLTSTRYYGVDQYWGRVVDYGFSKTREEALSKWGYDRVLSDAVRVVRITRPLVITSTFVGAPTDGHGNHQVAGQMAQEAYLAAGDPNRFPEQIREGLRPWKPFKVYARVPFFEPTKEGTIYDYATDKYLPLRFFDYVNKVWMNQKPAPNVAIPEGNLYPSSGLTFLQIGREGWGYQKSQNGGGTIPQPSLYAAPYHRYGSRVNTADKEQSFYDGIDISLLGIATLANGDTAFLKQGLENISKLADHAFTRYKPDRSAEIAPVLADALNATRSLLQQVETSTLADPGKSDVAFELHVKEKQLVKALTVALGLSFDAAVAPEHEPAGLFGGGQSTTFTIAIPGQSFPVQVHLVNEGPEPVKIQDIAVTALDGKHWSIAEASSKPKPDNDPPGTMLAGGKEMRVRFAVTAPENATLTRPYFWRPNQEQPYYDLTDERYRNFSTSPYPLAASARIEYHGAELQIQKIVQTRQRIEGIGIVEQPIIVAPAISLAISPGAGAVPLSANSFALSCTVHSNVKGPAKGTVRLRLPEGWQSAPANYGFSFTRDGDSDLLNFQVTAHAIKQENYEIRAVAEYQGKTYEEGYRLAGYSGLRPYPYYRPAVYKAVGVDVKTAPNLHAGFFPGTGDDTPRALDDLGIHVQVLDPGDLQTGNLDSYDAIVFGVRAYAVHPELIAANNRLLGYVRNGGVLIVQYNLQNFDGDYGPYPFSLGSNPPKVVDENSAVKFLNPSSPALNWPNKITEADFHGWQEERGHGFMQTWDPHYQALLETHDPDQEPQRGGLLLASYGRGFYVYEAFALYRQWPAAVPGAYRILANFVSLGKNPELQISHR
jgi:LmbE family N-acetylglucosaminyl deacetylase